MVNKVVYINRNQKPRNCFGKISWGKLTTATAINLYC